MILTFTCPRAELISANDRPHWARKARLTSLWRLRAATKWRLAHQRGHEPVTRAYAVMRLTFPDRRRRDAANYAPTAKAIVDGIVSGHRDIPGAWVGVLPDDDTRHLTGPDCRITDPDRSLAGLVRIELELTEVQP